MGNLHTTSGHDHSRMVAATKAQASLRNLLWGTFFVGLMSICGDVDQAGLKSQRARVLGTWEAVLLQQGPHPVARSSSSAARTPLGRRCLVANGPMNGRYCVEPHL